MPLCSNCKRRPVQYRMAFPFQSKMDIKCETDGKKNIHCRNYRDTSARTKKSELCLFCYCLAVPEFDKYVG